ncbi:MAG: transporter substrate-binding domain-containing protein [Synergistaceae bacterium]|jgi:polar amino acid transport system substrate-binding protein|nr:transporter substrate-binding domain-containing protein [Synergistaceae bacterium]
MKTGIGMKSIEMKSIGVKLGIGWKTICIMACLCALIAGVAFAAEAADGAGTLDKIAKAGKIVIGSAPGYYPFEMIDKKGEFIGYDIDVGKAIAEALGVQVEFRQFEFAGLIPALQAGEIDILLAGMSITGKRALSVSFSNPYFETGQVLMVHKKDTETKSWKDLDKKGKKIATPQGQTSSLLAQAIVREAEILHFPTFPETSLALVNGQVDGVIYDQPGILVYEARNPDSVRGIYDLISLENLGIACRLNDHSMVQWLNSFLFQYKGSPREIASRTKWMVEIKEWLKEME